MTEFLQPHNIADAEIFCLQTGRRQCMDMKAPLLLDLGVTDVVQLRLEELMRILYFDDILVGETPDLAGRYSPLRTTRSSTWHSLT